MLEITSLRAFVHVSLNKPSLFTAFLFFSMSSEPRQAQPAQFITSSLYFTVTKSFAGVTFWFHSGCCKLIRSVTELAVRDSVLINLPVIPKSIWRARWWLRNLYNPCPQQFFARRPISLRFYHLNLTVCSVFGGPNPFCLILLLAHTHKVLWKSKKSNKKKLARIWVRCQKGNLVFFLLHWKISANIIWKTRECESASFLVQPFRETFLTLILHS